MTSDTAARRPSDDWAAEYARTHPSAPYPPGYLELVERRSVAVRALQHRPFEADHQCLGSCLPANYGSVNLGLSNCCQSSYHDLCAGQVVVTAPGAPWSCGCLCHHARDRERGE